MKIDAERLWDTLAHINRHGALSSGGVERLAWTEPEVAARAWLADRCAAAGLEVTYDEAGNVWATGSEAPVVMLGSHLDTVPTAGLFDGALGIASALEAVTAAREAQEPGAERLGVLCFTDEEGVRFGLGMTGSRAVAGDLDAAEVEAAATNDGTRLADVLTGAGFEPARVPEAARRRRSIAAFLEVHVEQGRRLELMDRPAAIVTGIVGLSHWRIAVEGEANHAGTTRPEDRRDALVPIAAGVLEAQRAMRETDDLVATVGEADVVGGATNIVPGLARCSLDVRSPDPATLKDAERRILEAIEAAAKDNGCSVDAHHTKSLEPAPMDEGVRAAQREAVREMGIDVVELPSMAGHDAMTLTKAGVPCGMVFVRSEGGYSHSPRESSSLEDCAVGAELLGRAALALAQRL